MGMAHQAEAEVIRDLLAAYRLSAGVYPEVSYCGSSSLSTSGSHRCAFHFVVRGACWLHLHEGTPTRLESGDLVLLPRDASHLLSGSPTPGATSPLRTTEASDVSITCGYFEFCDTRSNPILEALPDIFIVRPRDEAEHAQIGGLIALLAAEARDPETRSGIVLDKLAEVLFAMVLRVHMESSAEKRGFLAALTDTRVGRALAAMHRNADHRWHMETLAVLAGMSRTAFAASFSELVGVPPMHYVTTLRMRRAAALLRDPRNSVGAVAARLGYRSEAAFRRAFKRLEGSGPGALRRTERRGAALLTAAMGR
jgi:AraC family transcriptional activator of mtrCDE